MLISEVELKISFKVYSLRIITSLSLSIRYRIFESDILKSKYIISPCSSLRVYAMYKILSEEIYLIKKGVQAAGTEQLLRRRKFS